MPSRSDVLIQFGGVSMQEDQTRESEEEARITAEWIQDQRRAIEALALLAEETRARAREAFAQARRVRENMRAQGTWFEPIHRPDSPQ
jgi:hypothetical protein